MVSEQPPRQRQGQMPFRHQVRQWQTHDAKELLPLFGGILGMGAGNAVGYGLEQAHLVPQTSVTWFQMEGLPFPGDVSQAIGGGAGFLLGAGLGTLLYFTTRRK